MIDTTRMREVALNARHEADGWDREDAEEVCDFMLKAADEVDRLRKDVLEGATDIVTMSRMHNDEREKWLAAATPEKRSGVID